MNSSVIQLCLMALGALLMVCSAISDLRWREISNGLNGLIAVLALLDPSDADMDRIVGIGMFAVAAIVLAGLGLARQKRGHGMSIAGLVLGVIGLLGAIGS